MASSPSSHRCGGVSGVTWHPCILYFTCVLVWRVSWIGAHGGMRFFLWEEVVLVSSPSATGKLDSVACLCALFMCSSLWEHWCVTS